MDKNKKNCIKCNEIIVLEDFRQYKNGSYSNICKYCNNEMDKIRKWNKRQNILDTQFVICIICNINKSLRYFTKLKKNCDKKICIECYPQFVKLEKNKWCNEQTKSNPNYRIKKSLAARLRTVMTKNHSTMKYLGCDIPFLKLWFEYNFDDIMNWDNYGIYWSIDHVIPVSKFNLEIELEKFKCWNWTNLVPISVYKNCSKKNILDHSQIDSIKNKIIQFRENSSTTKWFSNDYCILLSDLTKYQ